MELSSKAAGLTLKISGGPCRAFFANRGERKLEVFPLCRVGALGEGRGDVEELHVPILAWEATQVKPPRAPVSFKAPVLSPFRSGYNEDPRNSPSLRSCPAGAKGKVFSPLRPKEGTIIRRGLQRPVSRYRRGAIFRPNQGFCGPTARDRAGRRCCVGPPKPGGDSNPPTPVRPGTRGPLKNPQRRGPFWPSLLGPYRFPLGSRCERRLPLTRGAGRRISFGGAETKCSPSFPGKKKTVSKKKKPGVEKGRGR